MPRYAFGTTDDDSPNIYENVDLPDDDAARIYLRKIVEEVYPEPEFSIEVVRNWTDSRWAKTAFEGCWEVLADFPQSEGRWLEVETRDVEYLIPIAADG